MKKYNLFPESNYKEIIESIGSLRYCVFEPSEKMPGPIFSRPLEIQNYNCVVAGTACTVTDYNIEFIGVNQPKRVEFVIPKNSEVIVVRLLRHDEEHGLPHYNADDQIIFPVETGDILRVARKDAPDHYLKIAENSGMRNIADAYKLPEAKSGPIEKYSAKGATLQINLLSNVKKKT